MMHINDGSDFLWAINLIAPRKKIKKMWGDAGSSGYQWRVNGDESSREILRVCDVAKRDIPNYSQSKV